MFIARCVIISLTILTVLTALLGNPVTDENKDSLLKKKKEQEEKRGYGVISYIYGPLFLALNYLVDQESIDYRHRLPAAAQLGAVGLCLQTSRPRVDPQHKLLSDIKANAEIKFFHESEGKNLPNIGQFFLFFLLLKVIIAICWAMAYLWSHAALQN